MSTLLEIWALRLSGNLKKQRKGAAVLDTVILLIVAVVLVGLIIAKFTGTNGQGGYLGQIFDRIKNILNIKPAQQP